MLFTTAAAAGFAASLVWYTTYKVPIEAAGAPAEAAPPGWLDHLIWIGYLLFAIIGFILTIYKLAALFWEQRTLAYFAGRDSAYAGMEKTIIYEALTQLNRDRQTNSLEAVFNNTVQRLSDLAIGLLDLSTLQTIAIRLGILGTFYGLVQQLSAVRQIMAGNNNNEAGESRVAAAGEAVGALALAFNSSISGLVAALVLAVLATIVGARVREVRKGLAKVLAASRPPVPPEAPPDGLSQATADAIQAAASSLREGGSRLAAASKELRDQIHAETESLKALAAEQAKALASATQLAKQVEQVEARLLGAFEASLARAATSQGSALSGVERRMAAIAEVLERHEKSAKKALDDAGAALAAQIEGTLAPSLARIADRLETQMSPASPRLARLDQLLGVAVKLGLLALILSGIAAVLGLVDLPGLSSTGASR
ncbi:MotA/TolQ/ExbB proton channel family protein [Salinarimonas rosea]|uniref:MotA/TolQ/ExbB proton channel family protein n=1 Tax=Salinarimonas rosea TaxID=552063 RepID=UPI0003F54B83|nr:MotA/TolQ/ExbB proton channel family protein [Salinarimonas rosea]